MKETSEKRPDGTGARTRGREGSGPSFYQGEDVILNLERYLVLTVQPRKRHVVHAR